MTSLIVVNDTGLSKPNRLLHLSTRRHPPIAPIIYRNITNIRTVPSPDSKLSMNGARADRMTFYGVRVMNGCHP